MALGQRRRDGGRCGRGRTHHHPAEAAVERAPVGIVGGNAPPPGAPRQCLIPGCVRVTLLGLQMRGPVVDLHAECAVLGVVAPQGQEVGRRKARPVGVRHEHRRANRAQEGHRLGGRGMRGRQRGPRRHVDAQEVIRCAQLPAGSGQFRRRDQAQPFGVEASRVRNPVVVGDGEEPVAVGGVPVHGLLGGGLSIGLGGVAVERAPVPLPRYLPGGGVRWRGPVQTLHDALLA